MRNTTHEYRCVECGVTFKGRANARGDVLASNAAPSGEQRECVCATCKPYKCPLCGQPFSQPYTRCVGSDRTWPHEPRIVITRPPRPGLVS